MDTRLKTQSQSPLGAWAGAAARYGGKTMVDRSIAPRSSGTAVASYSDACALSAKRPQGGGPADANSQRLVYPHERSIMLVQHPVRRHFDNTRAQPEAQCSP
jgi:hypothetical protein